MLSRLLGQDKARAVAGVVGLSAAAVLAGSGSASSSSLAPVGSLHANAVAGPGVRLSWQWPASATVTRVKVRYATGGQPPRTASSGDAAGYVKPNRHTLTIYGLLPDSKYSFAVFTQGHGLTSPAETVTVRTVDAPTVTSTSLRSGTVGEPYSATLTVSGSDSGQWAIESGDLPAGLSLRGSRISGTPTAAGTSSFVVRYADVHGATTYAGLAITVDQVAPAPAPTPTTTSTAAPTPSSSATASPTATPTP